MDTVEIERNGNEKSTDKIEKPSERVRKETKESPVKE